MIIPALRLIKSSFPNAELTLLTNSDASELLENFKLADNINEEISLIDRRINKLETEIKAEEICPTCGQLIEESHEKAKKD